MGFNGRIGHLAQDFLLLRLILSVLAELLVLSGTRLCYAYHPSVCVEISFEMSVKQVYLTLRSEIWTLDGLILQVCVAFLLLTLVGLETTLIRKCWHLSSSARDKLAFVETLLWLIIFVIEVLLIGLWSPHYFGNDQFLWPRSWTIVAILAGLNATLSMAPVLVRKD